VPEKITLKKGEDKSRFFEVWEPRVFFQIPMDFHQGDYLRWVDRLFADFVRAASAMPTNENIADRAGFFRKIKEQGGVGAIYIGEYYVRGCKLYAHDDEFGFDDEPKRQGILMRDHEELRSQTEPVYVIAEAFELYLRAKGIAHQRFGRKVQTLGNKEFEQETVE